MGVVAPCDPRSQSAFQVSVTRERPSPRKAQPPQRPSTAEV